MGNYKILYRIRIDHDYFGGTECPGLALRLTPQGMQLTMRRSMLFRQTGINEWVLIFDTEAALDTDNDELDLELLITDPVFEIYTEWEGFCPSNHNLLQLPAKDEEMKNRKVMAAAAIRLSDEKEQIGTPLYTVRLRLTKEMVDTAIKGNPQQAILHFNASEVCLEYIFLPHNGENTPINELSLEDVTGKLKFSPFEEYSLFNRKTIRTTTKKNIRLQKRLESRLRLVATKEERKQIIMSQVQLPDLGRFESGKKGVIRQICYF